jgi:hypothetical protein
MRLNYIDNALATDDFKETMQKRTPGGFRTSFYSTSDASLHFKDSRNVLCITQHGNPNLTNIQPMFRHVSSAVCNVKSETAARNAQHVIDMLGLETAAYYGGGTNDNAPDAQLEILTMFDLII